MTTKPERPLTKRQRRFAQAYVGEAQEVAWRAAWAAGYCKVDPASTPSSEQCDALRSQASRLCKDPKIAAYIDHLRSEQHTPKRTVGDVVRNLAGTPAEAGAKVGTALGHLGRFTGGLMWAFVEATIAGPKGPTSGN